MTILLTIKELEVLQQDFHPMVKVKFYQLELVTPKVNYLFSLL